ncbi:formin-like protein 13 isoform X4 [Lycium barbarum]|uniref:formin-like protein 13 isoform X4 n=1 Tax=Lycium barbarum TaxID=112863 RepID=UPI00293E6F58|nr:formin-like protein 13 isoform X4 [Lycium barbarum]
MALFRKLFYRKPPEGVLEISERIYVFDRCFTTDVWEEKNYKGYVAGVISQLKDHYPDVSILAFNFREGESQSRIANDLSEHYVTIMDYPRHYKGCPLVSMEMINHFLRSSESWLSLGQQNVLLMHCEWGGWPVLAFMLAALLIYRRHFTGEQKTLDMIYKQAPRELLYLLQPLNPIPSQLRYLQYVARRNANMQWPPMDRALTLDCIIIRMIPNFDGEGGCRPMFRIYGKGPLIVADQSPKNLFSTPKKNNVVRHYKQAECELVKIDINCHIQGDVVLECINLHDDREEMMFRTMFNTSFIKSNILILNRDEIDTLWDAKDQFPKDFRLEVLFLEMDAAASVVPVDLSSFDKKDGLPVEAFAKVQEILNSADWLNQNGDAPGNVLQLVETEV